MKGWRTIGFNFFAAGFAGIDASGIANTLDSTTAPWFVMAVGVVNMVLRTVTTTKLGEK